MNCCLCYFYPKTDIYPKKNIFLLVPPTRKCMEETGAITRIS